MGIRAGHGYHRERLKKFGEAVEWTYGTKGKYCDTCKNAQKQKEAVEDCDACSWKKPGIPLSLLPLWKCFTTCDSQARAGFGGAYALDWHIVRDMAIDTGIETDGLFYRSLKLFESTMLDAIKQNLPTGENNG